LANKGTGPPAPHQPGTAAATANLRTTARIAQDDRRVTSAQSLLYAAASDVTIERVRALVWQVGAESPTIEYKEQGDYSFIAFWISPLRNSDGRHDGKFSTIPQAKMNVSRE